MTLDEFKRRYALQVLPSDDAPKTNRVLRQAAVLIALIEKEQELHLILTRRPTHLRAHPGQISFPGGKVEEQDADRIATALREAFEEIALPTQNVDILGQYPLFNTFTGFAIAPIIGIVKEDFEPILDPGEVDELFTVPLTFLLDPANRIVKYFTRNGTTYPVYFISYEEYFIWGATAAMIDKICRQISV
ncbi:CoA pyrophosphatase [Shewanella psychrotolerans]|uniref:CoA pyrophosphatase n=1 Tax=Shewanella psychrotolerans TaxID=2864206 RepID=UPI001C65EC45|nr:CoA pyrophosphatase [Shewanella psychrotolerans]QYJ99839.1 CoA pyrophosphatase [Shewanella psychrotolerans]